MAGTEQGPAAQQALYNTVHACFGKYLDEAVVKAVFQADSSQDFVLVSDVLWDLLPEVRAGCVRLASCCLASS